MIKQSSIKSDDKCGVYEIQTQVFQICIQTARFVLCPQQLHISEIGNVSYNTEE